MSKTRWFEKIMYAYTINRPITAEEREKHLDQNRRLDLGPSGNLYIIQINSIFLETVDKLYRARGLFTAWVILLASPFIWASIAVAIITARQVFIERIDNAPAAILVLLLLLAITSLIVYICYWFFSQDTFTWTHYPIRLNRKTRMVHAFKMDGSVLSVPWDEVFFTMARAQKFMGVQLWNVSGRVLDKDGITVKDNFSFGYESNVPEDVLVFWEYLRRYMEEGPEGLPEKLMYCPPIHDRREPPLFGLWFMWMDLNGQPIGQLLMLPFTLFNWLGRLVAMRTCKIPRWPREIEDTCTIEPGDPFVKDWRSNPKLKPIYLAPARND